MTFKTNMTRRSLLASMLAITLAACGTTGEATRPTSISNPTAVAINTAVPAPPATAAPAQPPTAAPAPSATIVRQPATAVVPPTTVVPQRQPVIAFSPQSGGEGTTVAMSGSGFLPGAPVVVRLGLPHPRGEALASAFADAQGRWSTSFVMPGALPSGDPITTRNMFLVAMSDSNVALASAPFGFVPAAPTPSPQEQPTTAPEMPTATADPQSAWKTLAHADINGDGIEETISYIPNVALMNQPSSVPVSGVTKVIATNLVVGQLGDPVRVLLELNQQQIAAHDKVLGSFGSVTPAGFVIGVTTGPTYSFEIAPVNANGQEYTQHAGIAWDQSAGAYRITNANMQ